MEVVIIEKKTFETLLASVGLLAEKVNALALKCGEKKTERWLDGEDVCSLLRISPRALQSLRDNHYIGCTQINRKFYYKPQEVQRIIDEMQNLYVNSNS